MPHILNTQTGALVHYDPELVKLHPEKFRYVSDEEAAAIMGRQAQVLRPPVASPAPMDVDVQAASDDLAEAMGKVQPAKKGKGRK